MDIRDIARLSGYSLGTVSRVINDHPNVSAKARERVLAVIEEQGYEPNLNAKNLKMTQRTPIAALVKGAHSMLFAELLEHVQMNLQEAGEDIQVAYLDEDADEVLEALRLLRTARPKGLMFFGGDPVHFRDSFGQIDVPAIMLTGSAESLGFPNLSSLTTDDFGAAKSMVDALVANGHRRIGIVGGLRRSEQVGTKRLEGALAALRARGIEFDESRDYEPSRFSMEDGYDALVRLFWRAPDVTAVFALGDSIALGCIRALYDMGRTVPDAVAVAGFDGLESGQFSVPRLTTIRQNLPLMAKHGTAVLLERLANPDLDPVHEIVPYQIYRRESVSPLQQ